jgi:hypothetical protein
MAKGTWQTLPPDHPIYQEGYTISSGRFNPGARQLTKSTPLNLGGGSTAPSSEFSGLLTPQQEEQIRRIMEQQFEESGDCPED